MPRSGDVEIEGISLPISVGAITANGVAVIDLFETDPYDKYCPFDSLDVFNNSNSQIKVLINQRPDKYHFVAPKTEKVIEPIRLWSIKIEEQSGSAISAGELLIVVEKLPVSPDTFIRGLARKFRWLIR